MIRSKFGGKICSALIFLGVVLGSLSGWAQAPDPDLNNTGVVNILDVSLVDGCVGVDLSTNPQCQVADTDGDGDVGQDDLDFVVLAFGQVGFPNGTPPPPGAGDPLPIAVDLDPTAAGIQTTLSVAVGSSFTIDVVVTGDGVTAFDTFAFDGVFNDLGAVLGLAGGTGSPTAGAIAGTCPIFCRDIFAGPVVVSGALTSFPAPIPVPFTAQSGLLGILSFDPPFSTIAAGTTIDLFGLTLDALIPGMSTVLPSTGGGLGGLALGGTPVNFSLASSIVTVTAPASVPEPGTLALFGFGLAGLGYMRRRRTA